MAVRNGELFKRIR